MVSFIAKLGAFFILSVVAVACEDVQAFDAHLGLYRDFEESGLLYGMDPYGLNPYGVYGDYRNHGGYGREHLKKPSPKTNYKISKKRFNKFAPWRQALIDPKTVEGYVEPSPSPNAATETSNGIVVTSPTHDIFKEPIIASTSRSKESHEWDHPMLKKGATATKEVEKSTIPDPTSPTTSSPSQNGTDIKEEKTTIPVPTITSTASPSYLTEQPIKKCGAALLQYIIDRNLCNPSDCAGVTRSPVLAGWQSHSPSISDRTNNISAHCCDNYCYPSTIKAICCSL